VRQGFELAKPRCCKWLTARRLWVNRLCRSELRLSLQSPAIPGIPLQSTWVVETLWRRGQVPPAMRNVCVSFSFVPSVKRSAC
jgi:hypothetical protein